MHKISANGACHSSRKRKQKLFVELGRAIGVLFNLVWPSNVFPKSSSATSNNNDFVRSYLGVSNGKKVFIFPYFLFLLISLHFCAFLSFLFFFFLFKTHELKV